MIDRSDNGIAMIKILNLNKHLNSLKMDIIEKSNISSEHLDGSSLHLNKNGKGKLAMNPNIEQKKLQQKLSLARRQYYVFNCVCNNDCKKQSDTAGPKHTLEIDVPEYAQRISRIQEIK